MTEFENVLYDADGPVSIITLNRPHRLNAMTSGLQRDLVAALEAAASSRQCRAVILTGQGRAFCAGEDLYEGVMARESVDAGQVRRDALEIQKITRVIRELSQPVIGAINGYALGGGCEIAISCDILLAADTAQFGFPETGLGLGVTGGVTHLLPRIIGLPRTKELILSGRFFDATEAERLGLVSRVVPRDHLLTEARQLAETLAQKAPLAVASMKAAIDHGSQSDLSTALQIEIEAAVSLSLTQDAAEGPRAFREKRPPVYQGR